MSSDMKRPPNILLGKAELFSDRIVRMCQYLKYQKRENVMSRQVLRSGTSIGANLAESKNAQSTPDYLSKQNIALKEADETQYWLNMKEVISMKKNLFQFIAIAPNWSGCSLLL